MAPFIPIACGIATALTCALAVETGKKTKKPSREENEDMPEKLDTEAKKEVAKIAMTASLGVTVLTAPFLRQSRTLKNIHTGAGTLFVGLSLWHHFQYQPDKKKRLPKPEPAS